MMPRDKYVNIILKNLNDVASFILLNVTILNRDNQIALFISFY